MRWLLLTLLLTSSAYAQPKLLQAHAATSSFTGPIDVVASPTVLYSLRAGSAAIAAAGTQTLVNIRRASDNVACDFLPALSGGFGVTTATCNSSTQGGVSYSTFVGSDGTASCTLAGTVGACTGASGTIHINDVVTGVGLTQPCIVASASNTAPTIEIAGTTTSCGTISVAETFTFQVAAFSPEIYDQSGNGFHATQATAGNQPQFLPNCGNSVPCLYGNVNSILVSSTTPTLTTTASTALGVAERVGGLTVFAGLIGPANGNGGIQWRNSANTVGMFAGTLKTGTISDNAAHSIIAVFAGGSSVLVLDGAAGTVSTAGTTSGTTSLDLFNINGGGALVGYIMESGFYLLAFNSTQYSAMHTNQSAYWGTP